MKAKTTAWLSSVRTDWVAENSLPSRGEMSRYNSPRTMVGCSWWCAAMSRLARAFSSGVQLAMLAKRTGLTILPSRKERDSYRTQRVPRWVPAAGPIRAGLTSQAIRASPALGYSTNLVFQSKNLVIVPAKKVEHSASALYVHALKDGAFRGSTVNRTGPVQMKIFSL
jgi:hypothetical protein